MKRHTAALLTGNFHSERTRIFSELLSEKMEGEDITLRLYPGTDSPKFLRPITTADMDTDASYYSLYSYANYEKPELLTIALSSIYEGHAPVDVRDFVSRLPKVPVILLDDDTPLPGNPGSISITADNYGGARELTTILIERYGCKNICFLSGPLFHKESLKRLTGWRDAIMEHNLSASADRIAYGSFHEWIDKHIELFFSGEEKPDAIVCAGDEMAKGVYRVAKKHGLVVGRDLLVAGFGDSPESAAMDPPLTTVRLSYRALADATARETRRFFAGEAMESATVPAEVILRESVTGKRGEEKKEEDQRTVPLRKYEEMRLMMEQKNIFCTMLLRALLMETSGFRDFFGKLGEELSSIGTKRSYILLLPEPAMLGDREILTAPEKIYLVMDQRERSVRAYESDEAPEIDEEGSARYFGELAGDDTVNYMLFYGDQQYGVFSVEIGAEDVSFYYAISLVIGSGLKGLFLSLKQQERHTFLEEKNLVLGYAANHDALTGLLNRAGVMNYMVGFAQRSPRDAAFVAVVADLDHLKQINDQFGHDGGDTALRSAAQLLTHTLPKDSPIGRTGGDEFTGCFLLSPEFTPITFMERLQELMDKCNRIWDYPFYVELSIGMQTYRQDEVGNLTEVLKRADENLYADKEKRRPSVLKENT